MKFSIHASVWLLLLNQGSAFNFPGFNSARASVRNPNRNPSKDWNPFLFQRPANGQRQNSLLLMGNPFGGFDPNAGASNNGAGGGYGGGSSDRNREQNNENFSYGYGDRAGPDQNNQGYGYGYGDQPPPNPNNQGFSYGYGGQGAPAAPGQNNQGFTFGYGGQGAPGQGAPAGAGQNNQGFSNGYGDGSAPPPQNQGFTYGNRDQRAPTQNNQGFTHGYGDQAAAQAPNNPAYNYGYGNGGAGQPEAGGYTNGYGNRGTVGATDGAGINQGGYSYGYGSSGAASSGTPTDVRGSSLPASGAPEGIYPPERTNYADLQPPEQQPQNQAPKVLPHYGNVKTPGRQQPASRRFGAASYLDSMQQGQQPSPRQPPGFGAASYLDGMQQQQQDPRQPPGFGAGSYLDGMQQRQQQDPRQAQGFRAASYLDAMQQRQQQRQPPPSYLDGVQQRQQQIPRQPLRPPEQDYSNAGSSRPPQYPGAPRHFPNDRLGPNDPSQFTRTRSIGVDRHDPTVVDVTPADYDNDFAKTAQAQPGFRATNPVPIPVVKGGGNTLANQGPRSNRTSPNQVPGGPANNKKTFNVDWMGRNMDRSQPPDDPRSYARNGESEARGYPRENEEPWRDRSPRSRPSEERWPTEPEPRFGRVPREERRSGEPEPRLAEGWPGEPEPISPLAERSPTPEPKRKNPIKESREIFAQRVEKEDDEKPKFVLWKDIKQEADENAILIGELKSDAALRKAREAREAMKARERQEQGLPPLEKQELPPPPPGPFEPIRETIPGKASAFGNRFAANTAEANDGPMSVVFPVQGGPVGPEASWVPPPNVDSNYGKALGLSAPLANAVEQVLLAPFSFANAGQAEATTEVAEVIAEVAPEAGSKSSPEISLETSLKGLSEPSSIRQATTAIPPPEDVIDDKWPGLNKPLEDIWPGVNKPPGPEDRVEYWEDTTKPLPVRNPLIDSKWSDSQNQPGKDSSKFVLWKDIKKNQDENSLLVGAVKRPGAPEPFKGNQNEFPVGLEPSPPSPANKVSTPTPIPSGAGPGFAGFSSADWSAKSAPSPPAQGSTAYASTSGSISPNRQEMSSYERKKSPGFAGFSGVNHAAPQQGPGGQYASPGQGPPQTAAPTPPAPPKALTTDERQRAPGFTGFSGQSWASQPPAPPPASSPPALDVSTAGLETQPNAASIPAPQSKTGPPKESWPGPQTPLKTASVTDLQSNTEPTEGPGSRQTSPISPQSSAAPPKGMSPGLGPQTPSKIASVTGLQSNIEPTEGQQGPRTSPKTSQFSAAPPKGLSPGPGPQTPSTIASVTGSQSNTEPTEGQEGPQTSPVSSQFSAALTSPGPKSAASFPDAQRNSTSSPKGQQGPQTPPPPPPGGSLPDPPKASSPPKGSSPGPKSPPSSPRGSIPGPKSPPQALSRDSSEIGSHLPPPSPGTVAQRIANSRKDSRSPPRKATPLDDPGRSSGFSGLPGANFASFRSSSTLLSQSTNSSSEGNASGPPPRFIVPQISSNQADQNFVPVPDPTMPAPPPSFGTNAQPPESSSDVPGANVASLGSSPTLQSQSTNSFSEGNESGPPSRFVVPQISSNKVAPNPIPVPDPTMPAPLPSFGASAPPEAERNGRASDSGFVQTSPGNFKPALPEPERGSKPITKAGPTEVASDSAGAPFGPAFPQPWSASATGPVGSTPQKDTSRDGSTSPQPQSSPESASKTPGNTFGLGGPPLEGSYKPSAQQPWNSKLEASSGPPQESSFSPASSQPWDSRTDAKPTAPTPWNKKPPVPWNNKPADLPQGNVQAATTTGSASNFPPTEKQVNPRVPSEFSYLDDLAEITTLSDGKDSSSQSPMNARKSTLPASEDPTRSQASLTASGSPPKGVKGVNSGLPNSATDQFGPGLPNTSNEGPRASLFGPARAAGPINTAGPGSTKAGSEGLRDSRFGPETANPPNSDSALYPLSSRFGGSAPAIPTTTPSQRAPPSFPPSVTPINSNQSESRFDIPRAMESPSAIEVPDEFLDDGEGGRLGRDRMLFEGNNKPYVNRDRFSFTDEATMRELAKEREKGIERGDLSKFQDDMKKFMSVAAIGLGAPLTVYLLSALLMANNVTDQFERVASYLPGAPNFTNPLTSIRLPEVPEVSSSTILNRQSTGAPPKDFSLDRISPTLQAPLDKLKEITPDIKARIGAIRLPSFGIPLSPGQKIDLSPDLKSQLDKLAIPPGVQMNLEKLEEKIDENLEKFGEKIEEKFGGITPDFRAQMDKIDQKLEEMMRTDTIDPNLEEMNPSESIVPKDIDTPIIPPKSELVEELDPTMQGATLQQPEVEEPATSQPEVASSKEAGMEVEEAPAALQEAIKNKEEPSLEQGEAKPSIAVSNTEEEVTRGEKLDQKSNVVGDPVRVDMKKEKPLTTMETEPEVVTKEVAKIEKVAKGSESASMEAPTAETANEAIAESSEEGLTQETPTMQGLEPKKPEQWQDPAGVEEKVREELTTLEMRMQALTAKLKGPEEATQAKVQGPVEVAAEKQLVVGAAEKDLSSQKVSKAEATEDSAVENVKMADGSSSTGKAVGSGGVALFPEGGDVKPPKPAFIARKSIPEATKEEVVVDAGATAVSIKEQDEEPRIVANVDEIRTKGGSATVSPKPAEPMVLDPQQVSKEEKSKIVEGGGLKLNLQDLEQIQQQPGELAEPSPVGWSIFGGFESKEAFDEAMAMKREKEQNAPRQRRSIFGEMNNNRQQMDDNSLF